MATQCCGILGRIFGHKFEARYSLVNKADTAVAIKAIETIQASTERLCAQVKGVKDDRDIRNDGHQQITKITNNPVDKIYERAVCIHCGTIIQNESREVLPRRLDSEL